MTASIVVSRHTTSSTPRPHVLYAVRAVVNGKEYVVNRRYSEFVALHGTFLSHHQSLHLLTVYEEALKDPFALPPKRVFATSLIPSAWIGDALIAERKVGFASYLTQLSQSAKFENDARFLEFLSGTRPIQTTFDAEDALPSTLSGNILGGLEPPIENSNTHSLIAASYYPDTSVREFPPEKLDYSKFDIIFFAFATPNSSSELDWSKDGRSILRRLVKSAQQSGHGTKVVLSVGGWAGCQYYSHACSNNSNRTTFTHALAHAVKTYGLDGIDIDWEYPNSTGAGHPYSSSDAENLLSLLKSLRSALGPSKIISSAVAHLPWLGSDGKPLTDVSTYAAKMTYINIMNYDVWGASADPGPNSPLGDLCGTSTQPHASAKAALHQWSAAGFPASKMLLGLPLYGYACQSSKTTLTGSVMPSPDMTLLQTEKVSSIDGETALSFLNGSHARTTRVDKMTADANLSSWWGQQIPFNNLVSSGALVKESDGNYKSGGGFAAGWDKCSDTPFLSKPSQTTVVTYDDTRSLAKKATFAKQSGMAGCFTWSLDQDDHLALQNVIRQSLGK
ncbi:hypothetical protein APHAL10511_007543 [Amanita phalloides]|nr:hypothetical protein APHAL10511_007543 [Amanita phalloides]